MKPNFLRVAAGLLLTSGLTACAPVATPSILPTTRPTVTVITTACVLGPQGQADRDCDPGARNHEVTKQTLGLTICQPGWTATVRPSTSYTSPRRDIEMLRYYPAGYSNTLVRYDHLIPLELGGATHDLNNLWPQPVEASYRKNTEGGRLKDQVCAGTLSLAEAQSIIFEHWTH